MEQAFEIAYDPVRTRVEVSRAGRALGFVEYGLRADAAVLAFTQLDGADEDAVTALLDGALDLLRDRGYRIVPLCPLVRGFLQAHPDRQVGVDTRFLDPPAVRPVA
ncbi:N-acetyltransferase [Actinomycetospora flava]|uniref:N-acetyltransferase n=1 Tax=Actinomycetospora flava TaxID=3129232 RepID=A0ABU8LZA4_9PSEU